MAVDLDVGRTCTSTQSGRCAAPSPRRVVLSARKHQCEVAVEPIQQTCASCACEHLGPSRLPCKKHQTRLSKDVTWRPTCSRYVLRAPGMQARTCLTTSLLRRRTEDRGAHRQQQPRSQYRAGEEQRPCWGSDRRETERVEAAVGHNRATEEVHEHFGCGRCWPARRGGWSGCGRRGETTHQHQNEDGYVQPRRCDSVLWR